MKSVSLGRGSALWRMGLGAGFRLKVGLRTGAEERRIDWTMEAGGTPALHS